DHRAVAVAGADVADALAAAALFAVLHRRPLAAPFVLAGRLVGRRLLGGFRGGVALVLCGPGGGGPAGGPLAEAVGTDRQQAALRVGDHHADHLVVAGQVDALDAAGVAPHRAGVGLAEADRHAGAGRQQDLVPGADQGHADERVALVQRDADDAR